MTQKLNLPSHIPLGSDTACCPCASFPLALTLALQLLALGTKIAYHISLTVDASHCHRPPLAQADANDDVADNVTSHTALNNDVAHCNCPPFSHALIPASQRIQLR
ncbi:unnamed protein product [Prorocentrum cordatum]|uniref:Uncharacterized protein n=1 Tax=Prorocentrum cordatum TaxID=2364126 RepID=A0ABN9S7K5_9DINO|nr:unnamed protein product [Polarella glacialis]